MNKRIAAIALAFVSTLPLSALNGCTAAKTTEQQPPAEAGELTEYFETGSEFLLQDIEVIEATETAR